MSCDHNTHGFLHVCVLTSKTIRVTAGFQNMFKFPNKSSYKINKQQIKKMLGKQLKSTEVDLFDGIVEAYLLNRISCGI